MSKIVMLRMPATLAKQLGNAAKKAKQPLSTYIREQLLKLVAGQKKRKTAAKPAFDVRAVFSEPVVFSLPNADDKLGKPESD